ncbi:MAG: ATP-binding protein [Candidatus Acidiferrum sp.]
MRMISQIMQGDEKLTPEELRVRLREAEETAEDLKRSNAELQQFANVAAHDLQEPLRMVARFTQLLAERYEGKLDATAGEYIRFAVDGAKRMQTLIENLLDSSRAGTRARPACLCDAEEVVKNALKNLRATVEESGARIEVGPLPGVTIDGPQLERIFQNLIGNAIKFRSRNSPCFVRVSAHPDKQNSVFSVEDNGIGIELKHYNHIFQMFQRHHGTDSYAGNGMGLAVCKKIIEGHGGRIWLESRPGRGSTFFFTIPLAPARASGQMNYAPVR